MRLWVTAMTVLLLLFLCITPCTAAALGVQQSDVYAHYIGGKPIIRIPIPDGADILTADTPDGEITVSGNIPDDAAVLVIFPIPDEEAAAISWFSEISEDKGRMLRPYEIYFLYPDGDRSLPRGVTVTLPIPHGTAYPAILSADTDESVMALPCSAENGGITFVTDGSDYYIVIDRAAEDGCEDDRPADIPPTGDLRYFSLWMLIAAGALAVSAGYIRKQRR